MAQFQSPINYVTGDQVTAANLNNHINGAIALPGIITDLSPITANTLATGDQFLVYDLSATNLRKIDAPSILGSNLPVTTSSIGGVPGADIVLTPPTGMKFDVAGAFEADSSNVTGNSDIGGNATIGGTLAITGATTLTGGVAAGFSVNGLITSSSVPTSGSHLTNKTYVDSLASGTVSKTANGHLTLPNGLIIQWGTHLTAMVRYNVATITFPIPFPNACFTVQLTARAVNVASGGTGVLENGIKLNGAPTTTSFGVYINTTGTSGGDPVYPTWIAIGH